MASPPIAVSSPIASSPIAIGTGTGPSSPVAIGTGTGPSAPVATGIGTGTSGTSTTASGSAAAVLTQKAAVQILKQDVQAIEQKSGTTSSELAAIRTTLRRVQMDRLRPVSAKALSNFQNSLVVANATGIPLKGNTTLFNQYISLYSKSGFTQRQYTDLTNAYNAMAAAVTSSNITTQDLEKVKADWAAVKAATKTPTAPSYPYFNLVTKQTVAVWHGPIFR